jgi:hypothetical protein
MQVEHVSVESFGAGPDAGMLMQKLEVQAFAHGPRPHAQFASSCQASALAPGPQAIPPLTKTL